jgi:hypothetical protein
MTNLASVFFGVPQSRYAALAILLAIVVVALAIIFGDSPVPMSQKFGFVLMVFLISLPGLALSLFQLTCIVTGAGFNNKRWWCSIYAWVLSAIMIFYAVLLVIAAVMSFSSKNKESFIDNKNKESFVDAEVPPKEKEEMPVTEEEEPVVTEQFTGKPPAKFTNPTKPVVNSASPAKFSNMSSDVTPGLDVDATGGSPSSPAPVPAGKGIEQFTSSYAPW